MIELGYYNEKKLVIYYHEDENYEYTNNSDVKKHFKTNSGLNAVAKAFHDLGKENITLSEQGKYWLDKYQERKIIYEGTIMEHAIGLSVKYRLKNLVNSKGKKLKRYTSYRNYYYTEQTCDDYQKIQELIKYGFMKEIAPNYFAVTWKGYYWLECKYDLKIIKYENL